MQSAWPELTEIAALSTHQAVQETHFEAEAQRDLGSAVGIVAAIAEGGTELADLRVVEDNHSPGARSAVEAEDIHSQSPVEAASGNLDHRILLVGLADDAVDADDDVGVGADLAEEVLVAVVERLLTNLVSTE